MSGEINFWSGVRNSNGSQLSPEEMLSFCEGLNQMLRTSPELAKIFFNTQVYNEIVNDVTTRGLHSEGVAIVAENLAVQKARLDGKSEIEAKVSGLLSRALGYMHDMGHTPFGHDGEGALGNEMERFAATKDYKAKRAQLFGKEYTEQAGDKDVEIMCYEHNETSSIIGSRLVLEYAEQNGYTLDPQAIQYIKTGILAHSTSRVKTEPKGVEQKAVRLADKVAYIPQDLLDLLKQDVITIDQLSQEEQSLLGLNEDILTAKEQEEYDSYTTEEEKQDYYDERSEYKRSIKDKLRRLDRMPEKIKMNLFKQLDVKVAEMQAEIATKCFTKDNAGNMQLDGRKDIIDFIEKAARKGEIPVERMPPTEIESKGITLLKKMIAAQKIPMTDPNRESLVNEASTIYSEFLQENYDMDPTIATLWVTKTKYQDAFIKGQLARVSQDGKGEQNLETLEDINKRNDNAWKMKTTFQFFYSNPDQLPEDFREKYKSGGKDMYTEQQLISAFIASFTNKGLDELYQGLLDRNLVVSRDEAISQLQQKRPDLDIATIVRKDKKWTDPQNESAEYEVSANDVLEFLYEENVGNGIVSGKNQIPNRTIPQIAHPIAVRDGVEATKREVQEVSPLLESVIDVSKTRVNSADIQGMVQGIRDRQNANEIQAHIDEVNKEDGRG